MEAYVQRVVGETRHLLRNEFMAAIVALTNKITELTSTITAGNIQQAADHTLVNAKLDQLMPLSDKVATLEGHDRADDAVAAALEKARLQQRNFGLGLAGLILTATGTLVAILLS